MNGAGLWHFNIRCVGLVEAESLALSVCFLLLVFFLGGRFVTVDQQLHHHHQAEQILL